MTFTDPTLERIVQTLEDLSEKLDALLASAPSMTRKEFAKRIGRDRNTVALWIEQGRIRTEDNRIPYSELKKFLS